MGSAHWEIDRADYLGTQDFSNLRGFESACFGPISCTLFEEPCSHHVPAFRRVLANENDEFERPVMPEAEASAS
jgi:hypothetical protein